VSQHRQLFCGGDQTGRGNIVIDRLHKGRCVRVRGGKVFPEVQRQFELIAFHALQLPEQRDAVVTAGVHFFAMAHAVPSASYTSPAPKAATQSISISSRAPANLARGDHVAGVQSTGDSNAAVGDP